MNCNICDEAISEGLRSISCPSCSINYHIGHVEEWTLNDWKCLSCNTSIQEEITKIEVILELHSNTITVGFAGESEPRETIPFQIGKPKYRRICGLWERPPMAVYKYYYQGFFAEEMKKLKGILKIIEISKKGMIINPPFFLQVLNYCFLRVLQIDPMNHAMIIANSVLTAKEQRSLIRDLLFDVFGIPKLYMSSHQYFAVLGTGQTSGLTIELDHDMVIIVPVVDRKIHHPGLRMEFLSDDEMMEHEVSLRSEIKDLQIIKKINHFVSDSLANMGEQILAKIEQKVLYLDLDGRISNIEKFVDRLQTVLDEYGLSGSQIETINKVQEYVSWTGINTFLEQDLMGYSWRQNPTYRHLGRQYLQNWKQSLEYEEKLQTRADELLEEQNIAKTKKYVQLKISSKDIEAAAYVDHLSSLTISPTCNEDLGKLLIFAGKFPYSISFKMADNEVSSHIYPKLEYMTMIKLQCLPYFSEEAMELINIT